MKIKALAEERTKLAKRMKEIVDAAESADRGLSEEERTEFNEKKEAVASIDSRIADIRAAEDAAREAEIVGEDSEEEKRQRRDEQRRSHQDDPNRPLNSVERARAMRAWAVGRDRADAGDTALLERSGLGRDGNIEMVLHRGVDEFGDDLPAPKTVTEVNEQFRTRREQEREMRAQGLAPNAAGGFTVPDAMMRAIDIALLAFGGMRRAAEVFSTNTGADLPIPTTNDTNQKGERVAEGVEVSDQDVAFGQLILQAFLYSSKFVPVSYQLMQDSATNMQTLLGRLLGERVGRIQNEEFTIGDGTAGVPNGIVTAAANSGVTTASNTALNWKELLDLKYSVDQAYRQQGAGYMMADATLLLLKKMEDSQDRPLFLPSLFVDGPETFNGDPVIVNNDMPTGAASKAILYGQLSKYLIREVRTFEVMRLNELRARFHQVAFMGYARADGDLVDAGTNPVKFLTLAT